MNYYPFHVGDYLSATRHLSWDEDAAYRRLLDVYYSQEKPLPIDLRANFRLVLAMTETQREAVETVLNEFFVLTESGWINRRADEEISAMREKQQKQRDKANRRWHKPESEHGTAPGMPRHENTDAAASEKDAKAMPPTPTPTPTPTPNPPNTPTPWGDAPGGEDGEKPDAPEAPEDPPPPPSIPVAERIYAAYPRHEGKQAALKAIANARRRDPHVDLLEATAAYAAATAAWPVEDRRYIPHPATWFNRASYLDDRSAWTRRPMMPPAQPMLGFGKRFDPNRLANGECTEEAHERGF